MAIIKTGGASLVSYTAYSHDVADQLGIKSAAIVEEVNPNYVYAVVRGVIGDVFNENFDRWSYDGELLRKRSELANTHTWETWRGKPVCVGHQNKSPLDHFGKVLDCWPNPEEKSIDMLLATSRNLNSQLCKGIEEGIISKVSMGCSVRYSTCTYCNHSAYREADFCEHIKGSKGRLLPVDRGMNFLKEAEENGRIRVGEDCHDSVGVEMSWVSYPAFADCTAKDLLRPSTIQQYRATAAVLKTSSNLMYAKAGDVLAKMCAKGTLTKEENKAVSDLLSVLTGV